MDTDIASYLLRGDPKIEPYVQHLKGQELLVSFMTAAELFVWAERNGWGDRRRAELEELLILKCSVVKYEFGLCREWARIRAEGFARGSPITVQDAWVAATARYYELPLVTNNVKHFSGVVGLTLLGEDIH